MFVTGVKGGSSQLRQSRLLKLSLRTSESGRDKSVVTDAAVLLSLTLQGPVAQRRRAE
jgi:hypothetical protein